MKTEIKLFSPVPVLFYGFGLGFWLSGLCYAVIFGAGSRILFQVLPRRFQDRGAAQHSGAQRSVYSKY